MPTWWSMRSNWSLCSMVSISIFFHQFFTNFLCFSPAFDKLLFFPFDIVSVQPDFRDVDAKLTSMNVLRLLATMAEAVLIYLRATDANVQPDFRALIVKMKRATAKLIRAQRELCAKMNRAMETTHACVAVDTLEPIVI